MSASLGNGNALRSASWGDTTVKPGLLLRMRDNGHPGSPNADHHRRGSPMFEPPLEHSAEQRHEPGVPWQVRVGSPSDRQRWDSQIAMMSIDASKADAILVMCLRSDVTTKSPRASAPTTTAASITSDVRARPHAWPAARPRTSSSSSMRQPFSNRDNSACGPPRHA